MLEKNEDIREMFNDFLDSIVLKLNCSRYQDPLIDSDQTESKFYG